MSPLARAARALAGARHDEAAAALAEAWRARRSPRLAALAALMTPSPYDALVTSRVATTLENLEAHGNTDDPLLATWVLRQLESPPFTGPSSRPLLEALVDAAKRMKDPRLVERAPAIARIWEHRVTPKPARVALTKRLEAASRAIEPPPPPTPEEERLEAELAAQLGGAAKTKRTLEDLLSDVYAHPNDDAPRLVLADFLQELGDPRGEFIALQFAREPGAAPSEREKQLLKKHGRTWLGTLAPVISFGKGYSNSTFERGFLARADIILSAGKKLDLVLGDPGWAVVTELEGTWTTELLLRAPLRGLRVLVRPPQALIELAEQNVVFPSVTTVSTNEPTQVFHVLPLLCPALETLIATYERGPTVDDVKSVLETDVPLRRAVFQRWPSSPERPAAIEFDDLLAAVEKMGPTIAEVGLEPPWTRWPRPAPVLLRSDGARYVRS